MFPQYTPAERRVDAAIHIIGVTASLVAIAALLQAATACSTSLPTVSSALYSLGLVAVFACSAAYHFARQPRRKELLRSYETNVRLFQQLPTGLT